MKPILYLLNTALILFLCVSCREEIKSGAERLNTSDSNVISINIENIYSETIKTTDIFDNIKLIPLETSDECLIGEIDKIIYHEDKFYILDCRSAKALFCFDAEGRFLRKIGNLGRGPGEYVEPTDFMIMSSNMVILDQFGHKLLFFDMNGEYDHSMPYNYKIHGITALNSDTLFLAQTGDNRNLDIKNHELIVINTKGKIKLKGLENRYIMNYGGFYSQRMNDRTIYCRPMTSSIYEVTENGIEERYHLNILDSPLPQNYEELCKGDYENFYKDYKGKYNYFSGKFIETETQLFFTIENKKRLPVVCIYDKDTGKIKCGILEAQGNEKEFNSSALIFSIMHKFMAVNKNEIIGSVNAMYLTNKFFPDIKSDDNHVLVAFRLKD